MIVVGPRRCREEESVTVGIRTAEKAQILTASRADRHVITEGGYGLETERIKLGGESRRSTDISLTWPEKRKRGEDYATHPRSQAFPVRGLLLALAPVAHDLLPGHRAHRRRRYARFQMPISVFPETNFPRVVIGVDNGVMPVEQMQVTITKPIEDAVNSVPGLETVRSTTSRGSAEVSLFFDWNVDMFRTLQLVDAALSKVQQTLPATAQITTNRLTFATFPDPRLQPDLGQPCPQTQPLGARNLRSEAAAQSRPRRQHRHRAGRPGSRVSRRSQPGAAADFRRHSPRPRQRHPGVQHHRLAGPLRSQS